MENVNKQLSQRLTKLENQLLDKNIIIRGVPEVKFESPNATWDKVLTEISSTIDGKHFADRMAGAVKFSITSVRRIGPKQVMVNRPILVKLSLCEDAEYLVKNRKFLKKGTYLDYEYTEEVERERRLLRPILKAARSIEEFQGKCRLDGGKLVIKSRCYNTQILHTLPPPLSGFYATTKSNEEVLGFFGELNPFSNFHSASFHVGNTLYHRSEQYIQHMKSQLFKDSQTINSILASTTAYQCKQLSRDIVNYNRDTWLTRAKELCTPGIRAKFEQNRNLCQILINTGNLKLIESSKDPDWGTGVPINDDRCLLQEHWANQGFLGEILESVRSYLINKTAAQNVETQMDINPLPADNIIREAETAVS